MALRTPPSWLQYGSHTAQNDRLTQEAVYSSTGVVGNGMRVTAQGSPDMTVNVASGYCSIVSSYSLGGAYVGFNDGTVILTITPADASNGRIDLIVATVNDQAYAGVTNNITYQVIAGTPAASPAVPATPTNSIALAQITVGAGVTSITSGNIADVRVPTVSDIVQNSIQMVRLTANGSAISSGVVFGATLRPQLMAGRYYDFDIVLPFTKTTNSAVTWSLVTSVGANNVVASQFTDNLNSGVSVYSVTAGTATFPASATYISATNYVTRFTGTVRATSNNTRFYLNCSVAAGTITPLNGASLIVTDLGTSATIGNIG